MALVAPNQNQAVRIPVRKRPDQNRVDHAEYRGVGADPKSQGDQGDGGETGAVAQLAYGITNVLEQSRHFYLLTRTAALPWDRLALPFEPECSWPAVPKWRE